VQNKIIETTDTVTKSTAKTNLKIVYNTNENSTESDEPADKFKRMIDDSIKHCSSYLEISKSIPA
jgi:hypothetical protein